MRNCDKNVRLIDFKCISKLEKMNMFFRLIDELLA